jgi:phosphoribosylglycinamide formyltransferase-1
MVKKIAVFASGTGSNYQAIYDAIHQHKLQYEIVCLISDRPKSKVIEKAHQNNTPVFAFSPKQYDSKEAYEKEILLVLLEKEVDLIVLAGYMRLIGETLLKAYPRKIINIHPSLLPSFKGKDAVGQAMKSNVQVTGVTIHYVDEGMDTGEIIAQKALDISNLYQREEIEQKIHQIEHQLYPEVIQQLLEEK